ncbi:MAG: hypothetical protein DDT40_01730 [candidate division WS2 bacterium]|nr:hypothetical protein [Candidatus Psychracetigena formicireducens]
MRWLVVLFVFLFITVPSIVFSVSAWIWVILFLPIRLLTGKSFAIRTFTPVLYKLILPTTLIFGIPLILYFYVWEPLGWIFFAWMIIYFIIRRFSGVHEWETRYIQGLKGLDALEQKSKRKNK